MVFFYDELGQAPKKKWHNNMLLVVDFQIAFSDVEFGFVKCSLICHDFPERIIGYYFLWRDSFNKKMYF